MCMNKTIFIVAGGTGGHILPACELYSEMKKRKYLLKFICRKKDLKLINELNKIKKDILFLNLRGIVRRLSSKNLISFYLLGISIIKSFIYFIIYRPDVIIGMGGYITYPPLLWASIFKKHIFLFEQNSIPGIVNKLFYKKAALIFITFEYTRKFIPDAILISNPIRKNIRNRVPKDKAYKFFNFIKEQKVITILGGSQGAEKINKAVENIIEKLNNKFNIIWITGKNNYYKYEKYNSSNVKVYGFLEKMNYAYSISDLIISRAGSMTLSEIAYFGVPAIFIPLKIAAENHQYYNALSFVEKEAGIIIKEEELTPDYLENNINKLLKNKKLLLKLKRNVARLYIKNSKKIIIKEIEKRINK